jgi:hypothetical protein
VKDSLSACLDGYRQSGELDSSGEFTLSRQHAQKKLQQFTLPEPRLYVLNLVASAVSGGASHLEFRADADELWMATDARLEDPRDLQDIERLVFSSQASSPLKELAIALNGILPLRPRTLELQVDDARGRFRLYREGERWLFEQATQEPAEPGLRLYVREKLGTRVARKLAARMAGGMLADSEEDAVFRYCNRCPVAVTFNGKPANRPVILGEAPYVTFSDGPFPAGHVMAEFGVTRPASPGMSGLLAVGGRLAPWVTLVFLGVNFRLPENAFSHNGLRGIVYCDALRKDLSQVQLVQDEAFERLLGEIKLLAARHFS